MSRDVEFWVHNILDGYIIDFSVDTIKSYSEVETTFFQGPRARYLTFLRTWIKMLVCKKLILRIESDE